MKIRRLDEFSLVDKPANPLARILMTKRAPEEKPVAEPKDTSVLQEIAQALGFAPDVVVSGNFTKRVENEGGKWVAYDSDGKKIGEFDSEDEARQAAYGEKKKMADQPKDEAVSKAEFAKLQERLEKAEADAATAKADAEKQAEKVTKMETEKRDAEFAKRAEGYAPLPLKVETFAPILRKAADVLTTEENAELDRILTAAAEAMKASGILKEKGSDDASDGTATAKVRAKVDELKKAHPTKSDAQLRVMVYKADPKLRAEIEAEDNQRAQAGRN